jgi:hypothetical protein
VSATLPDTVLLTMFDVRPVLSASARPPMRQAWLPEMVLAKMRLPPRANPPPPNEGVDVLSTSATLFESVL